MCVLRSRALWAVAPLRRLCLTLPWSLCTAARPLQVRRVSPLHSLAAGATAASHMHMSDPGYTGADNIRPFPGPPIPSHSGIHSRSFPPQSALPRHSSHTVFSCCPLLCLGGIAALHLNLRPVPPSLDCLLSLGGLLCHLWLVDRHCVRPSACVYLRCACVCLLACAVYSLPPVFPPLLRSSLCRVCDLGTAEAAVGSVTRHASPHVLPAS